MYLMRNRKSYVPLVADITIKNSEVLYCEYEGINCLHRYIKTRYHQPNNCLNCLKELGIRNNYKTLTNTTKYEPTT